MSSGEQFVSTIGNNRNAKFASFADSNIFVIDVDDEQHVRQTRHFLDTAEAALKLFLLARQAQDFFLSSSRRSRLLQPSSPAS